MTKNKQIRNKQAEFQRLVGFPIDSISAKDRNEMAEKYLFKMIEEVVELRKEFPSVMNPWSRSQKTEDMTLLMGELSDVYLFLINFMNIWKITDEQLENSVSEKQEKNFLHVKERMMGILNSEMKKVPSDSLTAGDGPLDAKHVVVANTIEDLSLYLVESVEEKTLTTYYTSVVKTLTEGPVTADSFAFWNEFHMRELEILAINNPNLTIQHV